MAEESLAMGSGLELLKKVPEQFMPDRISDAFLIFGMLVLAFVILWVIGKLFYLAMK